MGFIQPAVLAKKTVLTWPGLVTSTATVVVPTTWVLEDPKGQDQSGMLAVVSSTVRTFTPTFHSGVWKVKGLDGAGKSVHTHEIQLGDATGWMDLPDWDDAGWTLRVQAGGVITARSGKTITLDTVAVTNPELMDVLHRKLDLPAGLSLETEVYVSTISGDDHTAINLVQATNNVTSLAFARTGHGMQQDTAATQTALRVKDATVAAVGPTNAVVRRCRSNWALEQNSRSSGSFIQSLNDAGVWQGSTAYGHGGLGFSTQKDFGLWVGRVTNDASAYTYEITVRMKVS